MSEIPSPTHRWPLQLDDFNAGSASDLDSLEAYDSDPASAAAAHLPTDWQQQFWWTNQMDSPTQDDLLVPGDLLHPNYAHFYRNTSPGQCVPQPASHIPEGQLRESESEHAAAALYYDQTMRFSVFDAPVAEAGSSLGLGSEMQAQGSSQHVACEVNSRLYTTRFNPPPQSNRYMPYPIPSRPLQPHASPIASGRGDDGVGSPHSPAPTICLPSAMDLTPPVTVLPPTVLLPAMLPAASVPLPTTIMFGPELFSQMQHRAREHMKMEIFKRSFLMSTNDSAELARTSFEVMVAKYQNAEITKWSKSKKGRAHIVVMANTVKNIRDCIKNLVRVHLASGYKLHDVLASQIQEQVAAVITNLTTNNAFLYGPIYVQGQLVIVPFGHPAVRDFVRHLLFHDLNYQRYTGNGPKRNIRSLLTLTGALYAWAMHQLSTGVFMDDSFDVNEPRRAYHLTLVNLYDSMSEEQQLALTADIFTRGGQMT